METGNTYECKWKHNILNLIAQQNIDKGEVCDYKYLHLKMRNKSTLIYSLRNWKKKIINPKLAKEGNNKD